jgi:hypothetical protein
MSDVQDRLRKAESTVGPPARAYDLHGGNIRVNPEGDAHIVDVLTAPKGDLNLDDYAGEYSASPWETGYTPYPGSESALFNDPTRGAQIKAHAYRGAAPPKIWEALFGGYDSASYGG